MEPGEGNITTLGVVGAGTMGSGIAQVAAQKGYNVVLVDVSQGQLDRGMEAIRKGLARLVERGTITEEERDRTIRRITPSLSLEILTPARVVIEAVFEDATLKTQVFAELDRLCAPHTVLASNTSSISITRLAGATRRPDRVIGMHFFNPVPVMRLVEVVRGHDTSDETTHYIVDLAQRLGKTPVVVNDYPGFVSNRLLCPMINEAAYALMEGVASREAIDTVMKLGMNHPMGPLELADLIGLDVVLSVMRVLHEGLGDDKYRPCPLLVRMVHAGRLGRKTGRGFYDYTSQGHTS